MQCFVTYMTTMQEIKSWMMLTLLFLPEPLLLIWFLIVAIIFCCFLLKYKCHTSENTYTNWHIPTVKTLFATPPSIKVIQHTSINHVSFFTANPHPFLFFIPNVLSSIIAFFIRSSDLRLGPPPPFFLPPPPPFFFFFGMVTGNPSYPDRFFQLNEWGVEVQIMNFRFR